MTSPNGANEMLAPLFRAIARASGGHYDNVFLRMKARTIVFSLFCLNPHMFITRQGKTAAAHVAQSRIASFNERNLKISKRKEPPLNAPLSHFDSRCLACCTGRRRRLQKEAAPPLPVETAPPPATVPRPRRRSLPLLRWFRPATRWFCPGAPRCHHGSIDGIGDVPSSGVKTVTPAASTSYHLVASGAGGTADATARVTVNAPPAVVVPTSTMSAEEEFKANVQDAFFDYDTYDIRGDAQGVLAKDASFLVSHPDIKVVIGGYCDERGSNEYNLALGQNRADAAKNALVTAGVAANRIRVVSYGKEKPFCSESTEECWQQNRRAGFTLDR
jgi:peptidoglycan-associated lipoprotein